MYLLGYDCGTSSIKASLIDAQTGSVVASAISPATAGGNVSGLKKSDKAFGVAFPCSVNIFFDGKGLGRS